MNDELIKQVKALNAQGIPDNEVAAAVGKSKSWVRLQLDPLLMKKHRERNLERSKRMWKEQPQKVLEARKRSYWKHHEERTAKQRAWRKQHLTQWKAYMKEYRRANISNDPQKMMASRIRISFMFWIRGNRIKQRVRKGMELMTEVVGCTPTECRAHIEGQFVDGMTWENYTIQWEFDHIVPLSHFDLLTPEGRKAAMQWTNVRPLPPSINRGRERREGLMPA